jgi:hypothetical protein
MSGKDKPFERMVNFLVEAYGMSPQGARKLVVQSSEAIYTVREQIKFRTTFEKLRLEQDEEEARVEACKAVVNSSPTWEMVADEAHRYQLAGPFL